MAEDFEFESIDGTDRVVITCSPEGNLEVKDFHNIAQQMKNYIVENPNTADFILDFRNVESYTKNFKSLESAFMCLKDVVKPKESFIYVLHERNQNDLKVLVGMHLQRVGIKSGFYQSKEELMSLIHTRRSAGSSIGQTNLENDNSGEV